MKLKALIATLTFSTATLSAAFTNVTCSNQDHLDTLQITQGDCQALEAVWDATNPQNWTNNTGWDTLVSATSWHGIILHDSGFGVKWMILSNNNLIGEVPNIDQFETITSFSLAENQLTNVIPVNLGNIPSLNQSIGLGENSFSGPLPLFIGVRNMNFISLYKNSFTGTIPKEWENLDNLSIIVIEKNQLSGPLPDFTKFPNLIELDFGFNHFTFSDIEPQIDNIKDLKVYYTYQADINESGHVVYFDKKLSLEPRLAENPSGNDVYIWTKEGVGTLTGSNRIHTIDNVTASNNGNYSYSVTNKKVTLPDGNSSSRNLVLHSSTPIKAIHDNTPTISNQTPSTQTTNDVVYSYDSNISDEDDDTLTVTLNQDITGLTLTSVSDSFSLTGTPPLGSHNIKITITDGKIPVHINYTLHVNPSEASLPTGFSFLNGTYTHTATGNTLSGEGSVNIVNNGLELTQSCINNKMAYISIDSNGLLSTGFKNCTSDELLETFTDPLPNQTKASIVTNNSKKMILIELPLGDDMTLGGN